MSGTAKESSTAELLGLRTGLVIQELGWDDDVDDTLRVAIEDGIDSEMVEEAVEAVDAVLLWWREDDGDLVDGLVDALTDLTEDGHIWLMTPKVGRPGFVDASVISESALTAGMAVTKGQHLSEDWAASKLVRPKGVPR
ncbi:DUF3052 domain-containing protein [Propionibacteriaceae bacterium Y1685]|uniref:DUF3052 domain-containing protein n=1 Tax=Microlunatus sp. Y1700 TaxID=3418487 RepID=UPI003B7644AB